MPKKRPTNQMAFEFTYTLPADTKPIEKPPIIQADPLLHPVADDQKQIAAAKTALGPPGSPAAAAQPEDPGIPCDHCRFNLRPHLDYVWVQPGRRLCEDCLECELGLETFGIDNWYALNQDNTDWHREQVEHLLPAG
jgi:hypothetical protein